MLRRSALRNRYTSQYGQIVIKGTIDDIIQKWDVLAYGAESAEDTPTSHIYRQHADHWRRMKNENQNAA